MPSKKVPLINHEFYHVILRGVGDSLIFKNIDDHYRGIFSLYEFNNLNPVSIRDRRIQRKAEKAPRGQTSGSLEKSDKRDSMVEILAFCFMPNHMHLLLKQVKNGGITQFMQKIGTGYAVYFNKKYSRKGHLFNNFKAVHIETDDQLKNVATYIHTNPIALIEPGFKEKGVKDFKAVKKFLEAYKWSSYQDYISQGQTSGNFPSVTTRDFLLEVMGGAESCRADVDNWIMVKKNLKDSLDIFLE